MTDQSTPAGRIIGFTGTRKGFTEAQGELVAVCLALLRGEVEHMAEFHHGDCLGADATADLYARILHFTPVIHPPLVNTKRAFVPTKGALIREPKDYIPRNHDIVDESQLMIATPRNSEMPKNLRGEGTWATIKYAREQNKPLIIIYPDGKIEFERLEEWKHGNVVKKQWEAVGQALGNTAS